MKPISDFLVEMDRAEKKLKQAVLDAFKTIDEAKAEFIGAYNSARVAMETDVAQREQCLRETVARAVEALNGETPKPEAPAPATTESTSAALKSEALAPISTGLVQ